MWLAKEKGTHRLIGRAGIDYRMLGEEEIIEMGYVIAPEYQRQGYAYEVCQAIMAWAKSNLDIFEELTVWWSRGMKHRWDCFINLAFRKQRR